MPPEKIWVQQHRNTWYRGSFTHPLFKSDSAFEFLFEVDYDIMYWFEILFSYKILDLLHLCLMPLDKIWFQQHRNTWYGGSFTHPSFKSDSAFEFFFEVDYDIMYWFEILFSYKILDLLHLCLMPLDRIWFQ